jgi:homopolymeric O-antigen transport system permease protein
VRDLKVRYKQTVVGIAWAVLQPVSAAVIFTIVFGHLAKLPSEGLPYQLFVFTGMSAWTYVSSSVDAAAMALVTDRSFVTKVYFPRILAPLAALGPGLVDLAISLLLLGPLMLIYGTRTGLAILTLPLWIVALLGVVFGVGLWLSALNVQYRDVRHAMTFLIQVWLFASPVVYPVSLVHHGWRFLYAANPMVGTLEGLRWSLLGGPSPGPEALVSLAMGIVILATGLVYFKRAEHRFADVI